MLIYDKSGRELRNRILLFFFVVKILTIKKRSKVRPSDGHISTTKEDNKILWRNSLPLLLWINITKPIHYSLANVGEDTF